MIKLVPTKECLGDYLKSQGWLMKGEILTDFEKPGDGNMNFTLRIITNHRTFIIKQSREYVEKYPSIPAPKDRVQHEAEFYKLIKDINGLSDLMPRLMELDFTNNIMIMEDLGAGTDFTFLYNEGQVLDQNDLKALTGFMTTLHSTVSRNSSKQYISNRAMRQLNHEHIFIYPYMGDNGMDLDAIIPGLQEMANDVKRNTQLKKELVALGELYLEDGDHLLHGDYFPGSWLKTDDGIKIIDPEFCFFGPVEFEIGVMVGHLKMAGQPEGIIKNILGQYGSKIDFDAGLQQRFTSAEVLRRILGLAQLPLSISLAKRKELVVEAVEVMVK